MKKEVKRGCLSVSTMDEAGLQESISMNARQLIKVPVDWKMRYFKKDGTVYAVTQLIKDMVRFRYHNLAELQWPDEQYDVIFCRNVIVYMDIQKKKEILQGLYQSLKPGGYLFLGNGEIIRPGHGKWEFLGHSVYQKK